MPNISVTFQQVHPCRWARMDRAGNGIQESSDSPATSRMTCEIFTVRRKSDEVMGTTLPPAQIATFYCFKSA